MDSKSRFANAPPSKSWLATAFDVAILRSWWVLLFIAGAYIVFAHGMHKKQVAYEEIAQRLDDLKREKREALEEQEDLTLQINSQNDPAYIQMVLMKRLGVVPEGQKKVYFQGE
jgi:hypothetical protein